jgi:histidinol-phosphate aminotransferase
MGYYDMSSFFLREDISTLKAYVSARSQHKPAGIKLDANESPIGEEDYNRYPSPQNQRLREKLSALYQIDQNSILMTRGADEGIELAIKASCLRSNRKVLFCPPTYGMYEVSSRVLGIETVRIAQLRKGDMFALDTERIKFCLQSNRIGTLFVCRPNNPTGETPQLETVIDLAMTAFKTGTLVVIDEAYIEFSEQRSALELIHSLPNLIVLRTFSKAYGLAAVRFGCLFAQPKIRNLISKLLAPYPISQPSVTAVSKKITTLNLEKDIESIFTERNRVREFLGTLPYVKRVYSSDTNFILVALRISGPQFVRFLENKAIYIRDRHEEHLLQDHVRITIGSHAENTMLIQAMQEYEHVT